MMKGWRGTQAPGPQRLAQQQSKVDHVAQQQEKMETEDVSQQSRAFFFFFKDKTVEGDSIFLKVIFQPHININSILF